MPNTIVWCDIPVNDVDRAIAFYQVVLGQPVTRETHGQMSFGLLPHPHDGVSGCLVKMDGVKPSLDGPLVYLNCEGRLEAAVAAAEKNRGKILQPKHPIGPYGFRAVIVDS